MSYKVKLTYFRSSGKYYTSDTYVSNQEALHKIWEEVREMFNREERPGLVEGKHEFITLIEVPEHPHNHPHLIIMQED